LGTRTTNTPHAGTTDTLRASTTDTLRASATDTLRASATDALRARATDALRTRATDTLGTSTTDALRTRTTNTLGTSTTDTLRARAADALRTSATDTLCSGSTNATRTQGRNGARYKEAVRNWLGAEKLHRVANFERDANDWSRINSETANLDGASERHRAHYAGDVHLGCTGHISFGENVYRSDFGFAVLAELAINPNHGIRRE
jgi:hypothetical protein